MWEEQWTVLIKIEQKGNLTVIVNQIPLNSRTEASRFISVNVLCTVVRQKL